MKELCRDFIHYLERYIEDPSAYLESLTSCIVQILKAMRVYNTTGGCIYWEKSSDTYYFEYSESKNKYNRCFCAEYRYHKQQIRRLLGNRNDEKTELKENLARLLLAWMSLCCQKEAIYCSYNSLYASLFLSQKYVDYIFVKNNYMQLGEEYECQKRSLRFIFGETNPRIVREILKNDWNSVNTMEMSNDDMEIVGYEIVKLCFEQPLLDFIANESEINKDYSILLDILKNSVYMENGEFKLRPILQGLIEKFNNQALSEITDTDYTLFDYLITMGEVALKATPEKQYTVDISGLPVDERNRILKMVQKNKVVDIFGNKIRFKNAYFRLIAMAKYKAIIYKFENLNDEINFMIDTLPDFNKNNSEKLDLVRIENNSGHKFDRLVVYAYAFISSLEPNNQKETIETLLKISDDFSIDNKKRVKQIKAIHILTYLFCEPALILIDGNLRDQVFEKTFGRTSYRLQYQLWGYINRQNKHFLKLIQESHAQACTMENGKTVGQPYFFFLYSDINKTSVKDIYRKAYSFREETWNPQKLDYNPIDMVKNLIRALCPANFMKPDAERVYAIQALLYGLANLNNSQKNLFIMLMKDKAVVDLLMKMLFYSDYHLRKFNPCYDEYLGLSTRKNELYLLCGGFRFVCSVNLHEEFDEMNYHFPQLENKTVVEDYTHWLMSEKGRYKVLLAFLLSHSDFYDRNMIAEKHLRNSVQSMNAEFLYYDHLTMDIVKTADVNNWWTSDQK